MPLRRYILSAILILFTGIHLSSCNGSGTGKPLLVTSTSNAVIDGYGAITRGDVFKKQIALVLTGDQFGEGGVIIRRTLQQHEIKASFFLTGNFYATPSFQGLIKGLHQEGHYPSDEIYRSILDREETDPHGLNGFILLIHIGVDPRRTDKFYNRLDPLLTALKERGYRFVTIRELLEK